MSDIFSCLANYWEQSLRKIVLGIWGFMVLVFVFSFNTFLLIFIFNPFFSGFIHISVFWPLSTMVGCFRNILHHRPEDFKPYMRDHCAHPLFDSDLLNFGHDWPSFGCYTQRATSGAILWPSGELCITCQMARSNFAKLCPRMVRFFWGF